MQFTNIVYLIGMFSVFTPLLAMLAPVLPLYLLNRKIVVSNNLGLYIGIFLLVVVSIFQLVVHLEYFNGVLILHLIFLLTLSLIFRERKFRIDKLVSVVKFVTVINFLLLFSYFFAGFRGLFYFENIGFFRYRGVFLEPSIAAIASVFNFTLIWLYSLIKQKFIYLFMNLSVVVFTFSGSGFILMFIAFTVYALKRLRVGSMFFLLVGVVSVYAVIFVVFEGTFIHLRVMNVFSGDYSQSTYLRFFAPFEFIKSLYDDGVLEFMFGVSDPRIYIEKNFSEFQYFYLWDGSKTFEVNNGYAVLWALSGLVGVVLYFVFLLSYWKRRNSVYNALVLFLPFFTGHFVSIMYWSYVYIYIELNREDCLSRK